MLDFTIGSFEETKNCEQIMLQGRELPLFSLSARQLRISQLARRTDLAGWLAALSAFQLPVNNRQAEMPALGSEISCEGMAIEGGCPVAAKAVDIDICVTAGEVV